MTADELRRLSEIAGLKLSAVGELLQSGSRFYRPNKGKYYTNIPVYDWQPHLRIEQAYSVENGIPEEKRREYIYQLIIATGQQGLPPTYNAWNLVHATADQRCRAALAAAKE